jgi:hypothetical protein
MRYLTGLPAFFLTLGGLVGLSPGLVGLSPGLITGCC